MKLITTLLFAAMIGSAVAPTRLLRIVVIDKSGSTADGPLDEVKRQLRDELVKHPPSNDSPVCFIAYNSTAQAAQQFEELNPALTYIDNLKSAGGTLPAAGLREAIKLIETKGTHADIVVHWIHDGDEGDRADTDPQLDALDKLFRTRGRQGLAQAVQLRTWSGNNDMPKVAARLAANPHVQMIEPQRPLSLAPIVPLSAQADITIDDVKRATKPGELIVRFRPQVTIRGTIPKDRSLSDYRLTLNRSPNSPAWTINPQLAPASCEALVAASPAETENGSIELRFQLSPSITQTTNYGRQPLTVAAPTEIVKAISIPGYPRPYQFAARLTVQDHPSWFDATNHVAAFETELQIGLRCNDPWITNHSDVVLKIAGLDGTAIVSRPAEVHFDGPQINTVKLKLKRPISAVAKGKPLSDRLRLRITGHSTSTSVLFTPAEYVVESGPLPLPPATQTTLKVRLEKISAPVWYKPTDTAAFKLTLRVTVDGIVPVDSEVIVTAPAGASILAINPKKIHSGEQTVELYAAAPLKVAPAANKLEFLFEPPADTDTLHFVKPAPVVADITGPASASLVLAPDGHAVQILSRTVPAGNFIVQIPARFEITGPVTRTFAANLRTETQGEIVSHDLPLFQNVSLPVSLTKTAASYFFDQTDRVAFKVVPVPPTAPVKPLSTEAYVTRQAPFKEHLFIGLAAAAIIAVPYFFARLAFSMRQPGRLEPPAVWNHSPTTTPSFS